MKILAMFAALAATTTMASADPKVGATQPSRTTFAPKKAASMGRVVLGDRKPTRAPAPPALVAGWAEITDATPSRFGTVFVGVGHTAGTFARLRIDAVSGTVMIRRVKVHFVDGTAKVYAIAKSVNARRPSTFIDLGTPKLIDQIDITTDRRPAGAYAIYGAAAPTSDKQTCC